ncbi:MAG: PKD domain-containing protein [Bacteroidota bacterium]
MRKIFTLTLLLFATAVALQAQMIFEEDFEVGMSGWNAENLWMRGATDAQSSQFFPIPEHTIFMAANDDAAGNGTSGDGRLVSPMIDLTSVSSAYLTFEAYFINGDYGQDETAKLFITKDGGANWDEVIDLAGSEDGWTLESINLTDYVGSMVRLGFDYRDGGGWNYGFAVDDIRIFQPKPDDVAMSAFSPQRFERVNTSIPIDVVITNVGTNPLTSVDVSWSDGTNTYTESLTGLNVPSFGSFTHTHQQAFDGGSEAKQFDLRVWTSNPNATLDGDMGNDELMSSVSLIANSPLRRMVAEEATGTWCPWCPRGDVFMNQMAEDHPNEFVGIAVHNNDPMDIGNYDANLGSIPGFSGYPSVVINRTDVIDPSDLPAALSTANGLLTPINVEGAAHFDSDTREMIIKADVEAFTEMRDAGLRISAVITEDGVTGTGSGYAQANNYAGGGQGPMGGFDTLPNPVPANLMVYNHVAREIVNGWEGEPFITNLAFGEVASGTLNYTVPAGINEREMHVMVLVTDPNTSEVYNAAQLSPTGIYPLFSIAEARGCGPFTTSFSDASDSTSTWLWTFEGATPATSTDQNPTVTFDDPGTFDVTLQVTTNTGNTYTIEQPDLITVDALPDPGFSYVQDNNRIRFTNETDNGTTYRWDFGDGDETGASNPNHIYDQSGVYTVTLTAINGTCESSISEEVLFVAIESSTERECGSAMISFHDSLSVAASWNWTFEGGNPGSSTEQNPSVMYATAGTYDVSLEVTTMDGTVVNVSNTDYVTIDLDPTAGFTFDIPADEVNFTNTTMNGMGATYNWDFGDGNTSSQENPSHTYAASGTYTVTLTVTNGTCEDIITQDVTYIVTSVRDLIESEWQLQANPNPFSSNLVVNYDLGDNRDRTFLVLYNYLGQELHREVLNTNAGTLSLGEDLPEGIFFIQLRQDQQMSELLKVVKSH